jgi:hypothetical protein
MQQSSHRHRLVVLAICCMSLLIVGLDTRLAPATATGYLLAADFVFGSGFAFLNPPIRNTALSGMPPSQAGVAAAIASTSRQVGMTLGVAALGAVSGGSLGAGIGRRFAGATHPGAIRSAEFTGSPRAS